MERVLGGIPLVVSTFRLLDLILDLHSLLLGDDSIVGVEDLRETATELLTIEQAANREFHQQ